MPCYTPLKAYRAQGGQVVFDSKRGWSDRPFEIACGQCRGCRLERARQWALRCVHEAQMHDSNSFITLTYDNDHLPEDGSLRVRDWQLFCKKLRKVVGPFRYLMCGEYGERNFRPHYHACIFGVDFRSDRVYLRGEGQNRLFMSALLTEKWGHGFTSVGSLTMQSALYVASYVMKKATGKLAETRYQRFDSKTGETWQVKPEFVCMSRRPGLGTTWFEKYGKDVYPSDEVVHAGKHYRPPRFYDNKLPQGVLDELKAKRVRAASRYKLDNTPERLKVREEVSRLRSEAFERKL